MNNLIAMRFKSILLSGLLSLTLLMCGCTGPTISPELLRQEMQALPAPLIIDVRSRSEFRTGHIPGAIRMPFWNISRLPGPLIDTCRQRRVVVTCEHGPRAAFAAAGLRRLGCQDVRLLEGHMGLWRAQGRPMSLTEPED